MGLFGSIGRFVGGAVKKVGKIVSRPVRIALSAASNIPGVGIVARLGRSTLFPSGRAPSQLRNQMLNRVQEPTATGVIGNFETMFRSLTERISRIATTVTEQVGQAAGTAAVDRASILGVNPTVLVLGGIGLVGVVLITRGR